MVAPVHQPSFSAIPLLAVMSSNLKTAFVQEKAVVDHIARKQDIGQTVVVDIPDGYAAAIIEINIIEDIQRLPSKRVFWKSMPVSPLSSWLKRVSLR